MENEIIENETEPEVNDSEPTSEETAALNLTLTP